jgi:hypothetical protein
VNSNCLLCQVGPSGFANSFAPYLCACRLGTVPE